VIPNLFVTADQSTLDSFTAAREYYRDSGSMESIDQSHAQKASGVTTCSTISRPGTDWSGAARVWEHCSDTGLCHWL